MAESGEDHSFVVVVICVFPEGLRAEALQDDLFPGKITGQIADSIAASAQSFFNLIIACSA